MLVEESPTIFQIRKLGRKEAEEIAKTCIGFFGLFYGCDTVIRKIVYPFAVGTWAEYSSTLGTAVALLLTCSVFAWRGIRHYRYNGRLKTFFGINYGGFITYVVPSYRCIGLRDENKSDLGYDQFYEEGIDAFYKKKRDGTSVANKPFQSPVCLASDLVIHTAASRRLNVTGVYLRLAFDEELVSIPRMSIKDGTFPAEQLGLSSKVCILCFGSPSSNYLADYLYGRPFFTQNSNTFSFSGQDKLTRNNPNASLDYDANKTFTSTAEIDYAVLAKHTIGRTAYFLCAGINQAGSVAAVRILLQKWEIVLRLSRGRDFFIIYEVNRLHLRPEAVFADEDAVGEKPVYEFIAPAS